VVDPFGNSVTLNYDPSLRLTSITDAIGQTTTLSYSNVTDIYKITRVTDPFGRFASFDYDELGRLTNITDVIGLKSRFVYEGTGDFINALITPYGTNSFIRGGTGTTRWLETIYADGSKDRVEFNQSTNLGVAFSDPPNTVPQGMATYNQWLYGRNTFYWSRIASAMAYGDYTKAKIYHWLHQPDLVTTAGILESTKEALEGRVWYDYAGQSTPFFVGPTDKARHVGRVLDDGSTQLYTYEYNELGNVTNIIDPMGRTFIYVYDTNGIDLLEVRMTRAGKNELLSRTRYNAQHLPLAQVDAAGQTNSFTYNSRGQVLTRTNPKNETTTYTYDTNGYLAAVDGPLPGTNDTVTATYDSFGRLRTRTDADGYTLTFDYDALDRITRITHPDSSFYQATYQRLEPSVLQDRSGRTTLLEYGAIGQLAKRTDPLNRVTLFQWCRCGNIKSLTDAMGRTTEWETDVQGRLTTKRYGDGSKVTYLYEKTTSRARQITDEKSQVKQLTYNRDDTLRSITYPNALIPTDPVSYTYDPDYVRLSSMTDASGTTAFTFLPITTPPLLGAGELASVDGPFSNDTITYNYDQLGRRVATVINGTSATRSYDAAGRITNISNVLGAFSYVYDGSSTRILSETFPNGQVTTRTYGNNLQDRMLQRITHQIGTTPVSEFLYDRDILRSRITTWSQQEASQAPDIYTFGYDAGNQLGSGSVTNSGAAVAHFDYIYDRAGNRLTEVINGITNLSTYNSLNQITTTTGASGSRTNEWDAEDRLRAVKDGNQRTEFTYDGIGRLTALRLLTNGTELSFRRFLWSGNQLCEERDAAGGVTKRFFESGVQIQSGPNTGSYFYSRDHLGSIRELVDSGGNVRARYRYDPLGRRTHVAGDLETDFGFAGVFWAAEANLALTRYRAYDPQLGRFLSRDPLKDAEITEGANLYTYVGNDPVNAIDRLGLCCEKEKKALDDLLELIDLTCQAYFDNADRNCAFITIHPKDPWSFTCYETQKDAQKRCDDLQRKYGATLASLAGKYFTCLVLGCKEPCKKPAKTGGEDEDPCFADGTCNASSGKPAERRAFSTMWDVAHPDDLYH
jgi:RHS repeat-associated protein